MFKLKTISTTIMLLATAALATSVVGCGEPEVAEARATTTSRLGAPLPLMKAQASASSNDKLGIKEWRVYRGKNDVLLTGYNAKGSAVKGLSVGFHTQNDATVLRTRVMDGSLFAARHDYSRSMTAANGAMSEDTASFVKQALSDFKKLSVATHQKVIASHNTRTQSLHTNTITPSTTGIDPACGADMMAVLTNALQCVQSSGTSTQANPTQLQQCLTAAQTASASSGVCSSTVPVDGAWDATQDGMGCYDTDEGAWDSGWGANGGWGAGGYGTGADGMGGAGGAGDWGAGGGGWGDGAGGAGGWGSGSGGAGWGNGGPGGAWGNDPFGDGACPSCGGAGWGGGGDICGDSGNGGAGYGGETGGGGGGGWGDGW